MNLKNCGSMGVRFGDGRIVPCLQRMASTIRGGLAQLIGWGSVPYLWVFKYGLTRLVNSSQTFTHPDTQLPSDNLPMPPRTKGVDKTLQGIDNSGWRMSKATYK